MREKFCLSRPLPFGKFLMTDAAAENIFKTNQISVPEPGATKPGHNRCSFVVTHVGQREKAVPFLF